MAAQLSYSYQMPQGIPGTIYDAGPHQIDSRANAEAVTGAMQLGMGVMQGDVPGKNVRRPATGDTLATFEGISMGGRVAQMTIEGEFAIRQHQTVGVMRWGRAWVRVESDIEIAYGEPVYLITTGVDAGLFTNDATGNLEINAMFIGGLGSSNVAPIELYNQSNQQGGTV